MSPPAPPKLPAACADCIETTRFAQAGMAPLQNAMQQFRSAEGKLWFNFGMTSIISNPLTHVRILLDQAAQEARILTTPPPVPPIPGMPGMPANLSPMAQAMKMEQLGRAFIEGHEVTGLR